MHVKCVRWEQKGNKRHHFQKSRYEYCNKWESSFDLVWKEISKIITNKWEKEEEEEEMEEEEDKEEKEEKKEEEEEEVEEEELWRNYLAPGMNYNG